MEGIVKVDGGEKKEIKIIDYKERVKWEGK